MRRWLAAAAVLLLLVVSSLFAAQNGDRRVSLEFGWFTLARIPVPFVVFGSVLLGMLVMLAVGVRGDLKVRRILRDRLQGEAAASPVEKDRLQQDLFGEPPQEPPPG